MKKNKIYLLLFSLLFFNNCFCQVRDFRDLLMLQTGRYAPFVELNIKSYEYKGIVVVSTTNLYNYLEYHFKHHNSDSLRIFMNKELQNDNYLVIENTPISKWGFRKVNTNDSVAKYTLLGREAFIKHYFNEGNKIIKDVPIEEETVIIYQLLKWGIATVIGHETAKLYKANLFQLQRVFMWKYPRQFRNIITNFVVKQKIAFN